MQYTPTIVVSDGCFPFGFLSDRDFQRNRKVYVKTLEAYANHEPQLQLLREKLEILKSISHRNLINLKRIQEQPEKGEFELFYSYVHHTFEEALTGRYENKIKTELDRHSLIKSLHRQLIQLVIFLARNGLVTSFRAERCGIRIVNGQFVVKYYLPLNSMVITTSRLLIERSVNIFSVKSLQFLDQVTDKQQIVPSLIFDEGFRKITKTQKSLRRLQQSSLKGSVTSIEKRLQDDGTQQFRVQFNDGDNNRRSRSIDEKKLFSNNLKPQSSTGIRKMSHRFTAEKDPVPNRGRWLKSHTQNSSTFHTHETEKGINSPKRSASYYSSVEKYLEIKQELIDKLQSVKLRSKKALKRFQELKRTNCGQFRCLKDPTDDCSQESSRKRQNKKWISFVCG